MWKFLAFFLSVVVIGAVLGFSNENLGIQSPIPKVFGTSQVKSEKIWAPDNKKNVSSKSLNLSSKSAILVDYETGEVIFAKEPKEKLPVASTVKIMTALIALENARLTDVFTVYKKAVDAGENTMYLTEGEKLTLEELTYGMMLVSGNDAAVTIAEGVAGTEEKFVEMMNAKVAELGLTDTKFINASGLDEDGRLQYSTVYDLVVISHHVWEKFEIFRKVSETDHIFIEANSNHNAFDLYNDTNLLTTYPGVKGIKPGFTWEAGLCLVTYAENGGKKLLAVILGSDDRRGEMIKLLDYGFGTFGIKVFHPGLDM